MQTAPKSKTALWATLTIVLIALVLLSPYLLKKLRWSLMTQQEQLDILYPDTSKAILTVDSIHVWNGKVTRGVFEAQYSAENWYSKFKANKVAFDRKYNDKKIDVTGTISSITNDFGCSVIEMDISDGIFDKISFNNCPSSSDKWANEVVKLVVGQQVHIRGKYLGYASGQFEMSVALCHVIED